jgi:hypothetical protein
VTDEEQVTGAAIAAKAMGRRVFVLAASKKDDPSDRVAYVGIGMVDEILADYKKATMIALPRQDAELLLADLDGVCTQWAGHDAHRSSTHQRSKERSASMTTNTRELMTAAALTSLIRNDTGVNSVPEDVVAAKAVRIADAVVAELEKKPEKVEKTTPHATTTAHGTHAHK